MKSDGLNLAARPFSNQAPVLRVAVSLAVVAVALLVFNITSYRGYFSGSGQEARQQLVEIDGGIRALDEELTALQGELEGFDLEALNLQVGFLNLRIAERTFTWSRLFEDLGEVLPNDVRLQRLSPRVVGVGRVKLTIQGFARDDEGLLKLIDAMFAHDRFGQPSPSRESDREGQRQFNLSVIYLPLTAAETERGEDPEGDVG